MQLLIQYSSTVLWIKKLLETSTDAGMSKAGWLLLVARWKDITEWCLANQGCFQSRHPRRLSSISQHQDTGWDSKGWKCPGKCLTQLIFSHPDWLGCYMPKNYHTIMEDMRSITTHVSSLPMFRASEETLEAFTHHEVTCWLHSQYQILTRGCAGFDRVVSLLGP